MWISRVAFDSLNEERIKAKEEGRVLFEQNRAQGITLDWMRHRVQQLEQERAQLLFKYMGVSVQVPQFVKPEADPEDVIGGATLFEDVGDKKAKELGIEWDDRGHVTKQ